MRHFLLLDANVMAGYYLPRSLAWKRARERIRLIVDAARTGEADLFLYIPNFAIAETFGVFIKHGLGQWNHQVKKAGGKLDRRVYERLIRQFQADIHNGTLVNQYELSRYHILGINWVAPIDHYFQISRKRGKNKGKRIQPAGAFDHLIISMGIQLANVHGADAVTIVSTDQRMCAVVEKCRSGLKSAVVQKLKMHIAKSVTGREYSPKLYPRCLNLGTAAKSDLIESLGSWPLQSQTPSGVYRWTR
jgi:hypothetical protein